MYLPNKRPDDMERITTPELAQAFIEKQVKLVQEPMFRLTKKQILPFLNM